VKCCLRPGLWVAGGNLNGAALTCALLLAKPVDFYLVANPHSARTGVRVQPARRNKPTRRTGVLSFAEQATRLTLAKLELAVYKTDGFGNFCLLCACAKQAKVRPCSCRTFSPVKLLLARRASTPYRPGPVIREIVGTKPGRFGCLRLTFALHAKVAQRPGLGVTRHWLAQQSWAALCLAFACSAKVYP
jgi:hypothetical protein